MKNRNKKIILSIVIVLIAIFGIVGVNALNKNLTSKVSTKDEALLSDDKDVKTSDKKEDKAKVKDENKTSNSEDKKEDKLNNENAKKDSKELTKKEDNNQKQLKEDNAKVKNEQAKNNSNIDKSKITTNTNEVSKETTKVQSNTTKNEAKKQTIELSIVDRVNNKTLFSGQVPLNSDENFNTTMNKFLSNNGIRHINRGGYISMMYGLSEFSKGPNSGWCYYINGNKSSVGISGYVPKNGDRVVWKYQKDGVNN